jgi:hypothetical protein
MAITDFWKKKEEVKEETFAPKVEPIRGPSGRFVSKKIKEEEIKPVVEEKVETPIFDTKKETPSKKTVPTVPTKAKGPFMVPFGGSEVRRFYMGKWYYSIDDLLSFGYADPPIKSVANLKLEEKMKDIMEDVVKINEVDCSDANCSLAILKSVMVNYHATFPGSILRWIEDISTLPFSEPSDPVESTAPQGNPSDRG